MGLEGESSLYDDEVQEVAKHSSVQVKSGIVGPLRNKTLKDGNRPSKAKGAKKVSIQLSTIKTDKGTTRYIN